MLLQKLYNNGITVSIVNDSVQKSTELYDTYINTIKINNKTQLSEFLSFLSDDIYEFDCISNFSRMMIRLGNNITFWSEINSIVKKYNDAINTKTELYELLQKILVKVPQLLTKCDNVFINKILMSHKHRGYHITSTEFKKLNEKITLVEQKLSHDYTTETPSIILYRSEVVGLPTELIKKFYVPEKKYLNIKLDKYTYTQCHKYIVNSLTRKKIDDVIYKKYLNDIPKLVYLFVYRNIKATVLGYETYIDYTTRHSKEKIKRILMQTVEHLDPRCKLELETLSKLKFESENSNNIFTWDIAHYVNKWRTLYGVNDVEISEYFELNTTLTNIIQIISALFSIKFTLSTKYRKWNNDVIMYKITKNDIVLGELILDLYAREGKNPGITTTCVNTKCHYPKNKLILQPANIIMSDFIIKNSPTLLTINDLHRLFNEFGKVLCFLFTNSSYSIFGGMYTDIEYVDAIGKFIDLCLFESTTLQQISRHYKNNEHLSDTLASKINKQLKLDNGLSYKYQCMYGLFDLYAHSDDVFIKDCKQLMKISDDASRVQQITQLMYNAYDSFYYAMFNNVVKKELHHFHPIMWSYLFNGNENINFLKILSDIYAYELLKQFKTHHRSGKYVCEKIYNFISSIGDSDTIDFDALLSCRPSVSTMFNEFGLNENDVMLSLFNLDNFTRKTRTVATNVEPPKSQVKVVKESKISPEESALYLSPTGSAKTKQQNYFVELSESDSEINKLLGDVLR
jgi:Zn-dependent oligopeptidase